jgi:CHAT domain-containing protein/Flp pilus assembly protein TadD
MRLKFNIILLILFFASTKLSANNQPLESDSLTAIELRNSGIRAFQESNYPDAINYFNKSLELNKKLYGNKSYEAGRLYNALGIVYRNYGNFDQAIEFFLLAEESYLHDPKTTNTSIASLFNNIGNAYIIMYDFVTAQNYYQRAADLYSSQSQNDTPGIADIYYSLANINYRLNNFEKAIGIVIKYLPYSAPDTKMLFLNLKAILLNELNKTDEAYESYREAISYANSYYSDKEVNIAFEYVNFIRFLISINRFEEAFVTLNTLKNILDDNNVTEGINLALYYKALGEYHKNLNVESKNIEIFRKEKIDHLEIAVENYNKGLEALNYNSSENTDSLNINQIISLGHTLELLEIIADTYKEKASLFDDKQNKIYKQSLLEALDYYNITSEIIQRARKDIYSDESKIQLNALQEETFYKIIQTAYKAYEIDNNDEIAEFAFTNAEQIKSSSVMDKLTDEVAKENSLIPDSLTQLEKNINFQITSNNEKRFNLTSSETADSTDIAKIDSVLFALNKQREELNAYLEKNYSDYYDLKYSKKTIAISDIQKKLNGNEVLIEYVLNETDSIPELYSFLITKETSRFIKQDISHEFISSIEETFHFMSNPQFLFTQNEDSKNFCVASNQLYEKLISPFSKEIKNHKIIIIPDGKLNYITFEALIEELPDTSSQIYFTRLPYLIRKNTINYSYSADLLFKFNQPSKNTKKQVLAFAPVYEKETVVFDDEKLTLTPLPGIQREVDLISNAIRTNLFRGPEATEENFRKQSGDYDILHLAMHAFINDSLPAYSRFAFKQNNSEIPENDGWLNTADIYNLDLNARLTVLSACNTGSGELKKGEGVISLARGFLYAGCPSIIMTQWEVEDNAGTKIMSSFYENLKKGRPTDEALRLAKLEYLENANPRMAHPHYWLGYVSIGNSAPLFRSHDYYFFGLLILVIIGILIDQIIRVRKSRKH